VEETVTAFEVRQAQSELRSLLERYPDDEVLGVLRSEIEQAFSAWSDPSAPRGQARKAEHRFAQARDAVVALREALESAC
jgi:hypothetical protein